MIPSYDLKILTLIRNTLSVLVAALGVLWIWAVKSEHWIKDYIEPSLVVVGALVVLFQFLRSRWGGEETTQTGNSTYNIPNTRDNRERLRQAKEAIGKAQTETALRLLSQINSPVVVEQTTLLNARFAKLQQATIQGIDARSEETTAFNRINKDILSFVTSLERELEEATKNEKTVRAYLEKRYTDRLEQKLARRQAINLRRLPSREGTRTETSETFVTVSQDEIKDHIAQAYHAALGRLLITGKPGAGKTTLLLELVLALLKTESDDLPVLLNLSTWKKEFITLETWLKDILPAELGVSKSYAADLLQQKRLVLLFDGLDEVREDERQSCLEAIGRYRETTNSKYVITSRIAEYKKVARDAPVNLQIEVGDLTIAQIEAELERMGRSQAEAIPLLKAIQKNTLLREAAQTPFYFNTLQILFAGGKTLADLNLKGDNVEAVQEAITERFIEYELTNIAPDKKYTAKEAAHYLSFLAFNLTKRSKIVLELTDFQYDWYPLKYSRWQFIVANAVFGLVLGFFAGFFAGFLLGFFAGLIERSFTALFIALFGSLFLSSVCALLYFSFFHGLIKLKYCSIVTKEYIKWSWPVFLRFVRKILGWTLVVSLLFTVVFIQWFVKNSALCPWVMQC